MTQEEERRFQAAKSSVFQQKYLGATLPVPPRRDKEGGAGGIFPSETEKAPDGTGGIGTLSEKSVHAVLKAYYAPDARMREISIAGCVADIYTGTEILEIQSRDFARLRPKLERFLPICPVTVVYPVASRKKVFWIDPESGELSGGRISPAKGTVYHIFPELYRLKPDLRDPRLHFRVALLEVEEYRLLDDPGKNRKKGSVRYDRIPVDFLGELRLDSLQDYRNMIPDRLPDPFTNAEFAGAAGIPRKLSQTALYLLRYLELLERVGKRGNAYLYRISGGKGKGAADDGPDAGGKNTAANGEAL